MYYVYKLIDPRSKTVFYIGKGKDRRAYEHVAMAKNNRISNKNRKLFNKIRSILEDGFADVDYEIINCDTELSAFETEIQLIEEHGIPNLCNITPGGIGGDCVTNHPNRENLYNTRRGRKSPNKGRIYPAEIRQKMSIARKNWFTKHPDGRTNDGTFKSGEDHREFGRHQTTERVQKRVKSNAKTYEKLKTTMLGNNYAATQSVKQFDLDGNLLNEYKSVTHAAHCIGIPRHRIYNVLCGNQNQTAGFRFERSK